MPAKSVPTKPLSPAGVKRREIEKTSVYQYIEKATEEEMDETGTFRPKVVMALSYVRVLS